MERQATNWGEKSANYLADERLVHAIYKAPSKLNSKITNHPIFKKWARDLNRRFPRGSVSKQAHATMMDINSPRENASEGHAEPRAPS